MAAGTSTLHVLSFFVLSVDHICEGLFCAKVVHNARKTGPCASAPKKAKPSINFASFCSSSLCLIQSCPSCQSQSFSKGR